MRRLKIFSCPVPDALTRAPASGSERWCEHCERHVSDTRDLDAAQFDELIQRAASSRVCMQLELEGRRPKLRLGRDRALGGGEAQGQLRSALAANVLVAVLAGCASMDAIAPALQPRVFMHSEPLASESSQITGFVIDEAGQALPGAVVELQGDGLSTPVQAISDELGMYGFSDVPPGDYVMVVSSGLGIADAVVSVLEARMYESAFEDPTRPRISLIAGYVEIVTIAPGSFSAPGPYLVDGG